MWIIQHSKSVPEQFLIVRVLQRKKKNKNTKVLITYSVIYRIFSFFFCFDRFFRYFAGKGCSRRKNYGHNRHQGLKINTKRCFVFRFTPILFLTVIFAILVRHIELKTLKEKAGLQSHTMSYAEEHNVSKWRTFLKKRRRESAVKEIIKIAVMMSHN